MQKVRAGLLRTIGLVAVLALIAAGCGGGGAGGGGEETGLSSATVAVGSKEFTEQLILGNITKLVLEDAGVTVKDQIGLGGTNVARQALTGGEIDMYWEYTGTGWITHLGHTDPIPDPQEQFKAVAKEDLNKNNIKWLQPPAPANNTYTLAVRSEAYEDIGVEKLSGLKQLIEESPEKATLCTDSEFATRDDGLPGMQEAYGFQFPEGNVTRLQIGAIYESVDNGDPCNFGVVFQTDGRNEALDFKLLEDDQGFFPVYNPALNVRQEVSEQYPELQELFAPISEALTTDQLQSLNAKVDVDGKLPESVAEQWLQENDFIG